MTCDEVQDHGLAEAYVLGRLEGDARAAFEEHYFECAACFGNLQEVWDVRSALAPARRLAGDARRPPRPRVWLAAAATAAVAASVLIQVLPDARLSADGRPLPPAATVLEDRGVRLEATRALPSVPPSPSGSPAMLVADARDQLLELGRVETPPRYAPVVLRAPRDSARQAFEAAMMDYGRGDYTRAASRLERAAREQPTAPDAWFFLGVCRLLRDEPAAGIAALEKAIAVGDSPYQAEARFYLAKGRLLQGDRAGAEAELRALAAEGGDFAKGAAELLGRLP